MGGDFYRNITLIAKVCSNLGQVPLAVVLINIGKVIL